MASEITIRPAVELDVPELVRLLRRSWLVTWAPELPFEAVQAFAAADPARWIAESEWQSYVVATRDDMLLAMVQTRFHQSAARRPGPLEWRRGIEAAQCGCAANRMFIRGCALGSA
jgi:hypothetical protein